MFVASLILSFFPRESFTNNVESGTSNKMELTREAKYTGDFNIIGDKKNGVVLTFNCCQSIMTHFSIQMRIVNSETN